MPSIYLYGGNARFPCKNCTDRVPGCHSKCDKYRDRKTNKEKTKSKEN